VSYKWKRADGYFDMEIKPMLLPVDPNKVTNTSSSQTDKPSTNTSSSEVEEEKVIITTSPPRKRKRKEKRSTTTTVEETNKKSVSRRRCNFINCKSCAASKNFSFNRLPKPPTLKNKEKQNKDKRNRDIMTYHVEKYFYNLCMRRIGRKPNTIQDVRICNIHRIEKIEKDVNWLDDDNILQKIRVTMYLPAGDGVAAISTISPNDATTSQHKRQNRGLAKDRWLNQLLQRVDSLSNECMLLSQMIEVAEGNINEINPVVAQTSGLPIDRLQQEKIRVEIPKEAYEKVIDKRTRVRFNDLTDSYVKTTTGFSSVSILLAFIFVVTNGNINQVEHTTTHLSWLEEWFVFFETVWCKHCTRWIDLSIQYNVHSKTLRNFLTTN
jgi:hypothetical protein